jgi:hypothetical protein
MGAVVVADMDTDRLVDTVEVVQEAEDDMTVEVLTVEEVGRRKGVEAVNGMEGDRTLLRV